MNIILLGAPGAGKGTEASKIVDTYKLPHISTGDIFRENIKNQTPIGVQAKSYIDQGLLVPDEVTCKIVEERISREDCKNGYMLDGFPRTIAQAEALDKSGIDIDCVLTLEVGDEEIVERLSGRLECKICGSSFHKDHRKPKAEGVCDNCGGTLRTREDDKPDVIRARLKTYYEQTAPLKEFYAKKGMLKTVIGKNEIASTSAEVLKVLGV